MAKRKFILIALLLAIPIIVVGLIGYSLALLLLGFNPGLPYQLLISVLAIFSHLQGSCADFGACQEPGGCCGQWERDVQCCTDICDITSEYSQGRTCMCAS